MLLVVSVPQFLFFSSVVCGAAPWTHKTPRCVGVLSAVAPTTCEVFVGGKKTVCGVGREATCWVEGDSVLAV